MAFTAVNPFDGKGGWPPEIFVERRTLRRKVLKCGRRDCRKILRDPWQLECGHRCCGECVEDMRKLPEDDRYCTECLEDVMYDDTRVEQPHESPEFYPYGRDTLLARIDLSKCRQDRAAWRELNRLLVCCPFHCDWEKTSPTKPKLRDIEKHVAECPKRQMKCGLCGSVVTLEETDGHAKDSCSKRIVPCPYACDKDNLIAADLDGHLSECPNKPYQCPICRTDTRSSLSQHLMESCVGVCPLGCEGGKQLKMADHLTHRATQNVHLNQILDYVLKCHQAPDAAMYDIISRQLEVEGYLDEMESQLQSRLKIDDTQLSLGSVDQSASAQADLKDLEAEVARIDKDVDSFTSLLDKADMLKKGASMWERRVAEQTSAVEDRGGALQDEILSQKDAIASMTLPAYNGRLVWRLDRVSELSASGASLDSPEFYSSRYGRRMLLKLKFEETDEDNLKMRLSFCVVKGKYDGIVDWPFQPQVTLRVLHAGETTPQSHAAHKLNDVCAERPCGSEPAKTAATTVTIKTQKSASTDEVFEDRDVIFVETVVNETES